MDVWMLRSLEEKKERRLGCPTFMGGVNQSRGHMAKWAHSGTADLDLVS